MTTEISNLESQISNSTAKAADDLEHIRMLKHNRHFTGYFMRRLMERIASREKIILDPETSPEATTLEKKIVQALKDDVLNLLEDDEIGCESLLGQGD